ncbi:DUF2190 family protein [Leisingera methylohalidivorans]|uniref:DUF2190 domain-containing protein n=1 Tax=Leisingera methylohalidivorans DSM 14336 TaxID=999552 RepID=V9VT35_9RHOB|nr:DUF2190 family protein [Leisingera methylohalidivorans]AHD01188.1 hypothetical protein METH_11315 [Leisingera methylohalidivorans DSM 14336]
MIPTFIRGYEAASEITGYRIVKFADPANGQTIDLADSNTAASLGVSDSMGAPAGGMCDVHRAGLVPVILGGPVSTGDPLTSDADAAAVLAAGTASTTVRIVGFADEPGIAGDTIMAFLAPGLLHEA